VIDKNEKEILIGHVLVVYRTTIGFTSADPDCNSVVLNIQDTLLCIGYHDDPENFIRPEIMALHSRIGLVYIGQCECRALSIVSE